MVPEYHDCQRFLSKNKASYGSMVAIFARSGLDSVYDPTPGGGPIGRGERAAATIFNYDDPYEPLRIEKGVNCLYLHPENGEWKAKILRVQSDTDCLTPEAGTPDGKPLLVTVVPGIQGHDIPPVARWDWDDVEQEQYIGIRCGTQWCEVYNPSHQSLNSSATYAGPSVVHVKGWYDEQNLAVNGPTAGTLLPGGVVGTIFPIGELDLNTEIQFNTWKPVALVSLSAASPTYLNKYNFVVGPPPLGQSQISLCKGDRNACGIPATEQVNDCDQKGDPWWAEIKSGRAVKYRCVIRRQHPGVPIPGAVRWRWQNEDDAMWIRCPLGCCEVT
jgi:hypothetical protein